MNMKKYLPSLPNMNMKNLNTIIHNKIVLYFVFFLAFFQISYLLYREPIEYDIIALFVLTSLLTSFFSKNMIIILSVGLLVSNIVRVGVMRREGFEVEEDTEKEEEKKEKGEKEGKEKKKTPMVDKDMEEEIKKQYPEFKEVHKKILDGIEDMKPLIKKVEGFMDTMKKAKEQEK